MDSKNAVAHANACIDFFPLLMHIKPGICLSLRVWDRAIHRPAAERLKRIQGGPVGLVEVQNSIVALQSAFRRREHVPVYPTDIQ